MAYRIGQQSTLDAAQGLEQGVVVKLMSAMYCVPNPTSDIADRLWRGCIYLSIYLSIARHHLYSSNTVGLHEHISLEGADICISEPFSYTDRATNQPRLSCLLVHPPLGHSVKSLVNLHLYTT